MSTTTISAVFLTEGEPMNDKMLSIEVPSKIWKNTVLLMLSFILCLIIIVNYPTKQKQNKPILQHPQTEVEGKVCSTYLAHQKPLPSPSY